ncbi:MAG: ABC transporter substrate-binding subunit SaoX [Thermoanaerobacterales bacterium]|nr:ABC transporter substrate-binding subunit SaoX [Thermoanaerobacterales bacterium]
MKKNKVCIMAIMLIGILLIGAGCADSQQAQPSQESKNDLAAELAKTYNLKPLSEEDANYTIKMGYYNCDHMTAAVIGKDAGIFEALGLKVNLTGNGNVPEAMAAGKMDVGYAGWTTTLRAVPKGTPLFIAAQNHTGGSEYLVVSNDIKKPEDLIGKKISLGSDPETENLNWAEWSDQLGIPRDSSYYENFNMSDKDEYYALKAGKLDAYICCDPWGSMAEYEGTGWCMMTQTTLRNGELGTCCKVAMHRDFAEKHPELAKRVLLAHTLSIQYMYLHPYKAAEIFAKNYNVPLEVALMTMWKKTNKEGRTISWDLNIEELKNQLKVMQKYGVQNDINRVNVEDYVDTSYMDACGAKDFKKFIKEEVDPIFPLGMSYEDWKAKAMEIDNIKSS